MQIVYYSEDGQEFSTEKECMKHEDELKKAEQKKKDLEAEKSKRWEEVQTAYKQYEEKIEKLNKAKTEAYEDYLKIRNKYCEDYPNHTTNDIYSSLADLLNNIYI